MPTREEHEDDDDHRAEEDDLDPEGPDPSEMDSSDEPDLDVCPHCRKLISEEAARCPHCGEYINPADAPLARPWWIVIVAILVLMLAGLLWIF